MAKETKPLTTYVTEFYCQLSKGWPENYEIDYSHYTARGLMVHITDKIDSRKYIMEIYPDE